MRPQPTLTLTLTIGLILWAVCASDSLTWVSVPPPTVILSRGQRAILPCQAKGLAGSFISPVWSFLPLSSNLSHSIEMATTLSNGSLLVTDVKAANEGAYLCVMTDGATSQTHRTELRLSRLSPFLVSPNSVSVSYGEPVVLECVTGVALPTPTIFWVKDSLSTSLGIQTNATYLSPGFAGSRQLSMRLQLVATEESEGQYQCAAQNPITQDRIYSWPATISLNDYRPQFIQQLPSEFSAPEGQPLLLACPAMGRPIPIVTWFYNNATLDNQSSAIIVNGSLSFPQLRRTNSGNYSCLATNAVGSAMSSQILLRVAYMDSMFVQQPSNATSVTGQFLQMLCVPPHSQPPPSLLWYKDNRVLTGYSNQSLEFRSVQISDAGVYFCVALNAQAIPTSVTSRKATLTVFSSPAFLDPVKGNSPVSIGEAAEIHCHVQGYPSPVIQWFKDGLEYGEDSRAVRVEGNQSLYISGVTLMDAGKYLCNATNSYGSALSTVYILEVLSPPALWSGVGSHTVYAGENVLLPCLFVGYPPPAVEWYKNGTLLDLTDSHVRFDLGQGLNIYNVSIADAGSYHCRVTGSSLIEPLSSSGSLNVLMRQRITRFAVPVSIAEGRLAEIACDGEGEPAPALSIYHFEMERAKGQGHAFALINTTLADSGTWSCTAGSETVSHDMRVTYPPRNVLIAGASVVVAGTALELNCSAQANPLPLITWYYQQMIAQSDLTGNVEVTSNGCMKIKHTNAAHTGLYTCAARNELGENNSSIVVYVVDIKLTSNDSSELEVTWKPIEQPQLYGILYFVIEYRRSSETSFTRISQNISSSVASFTIRGLLSASEYCVRMAAGNQLGYGPFTSCYFAYTRPDAYEVSVTQLTTRTGSPSALVAVPASSTVSATSLTMRTELTDHDLNRIDSSRATVSRSGEVTGVSLLISTSGPPLTTSTAKSTVHDYSFLMQTTRITMATMADILYSAASADTLSTTSPAVAAGLKLPDLALTIVIPLAVLLVVLISAVVIICCWQRYRRRHQTSSYFSQKFTSATALPVHGYGSCPNLDGDTLSESHSSYSEVGRGDLQVMQEAKLSELDLTEMKGKTRSNSHPRLDTSVKSRSVRRILNDDFDLYNASETEMDRANIPENRLFDYREISVSGQSLGIDSLKLEDRVATMRRRNEENRTSVEDLDEAQLKRVTMREGKVRVEVAELIASQIARSSTPIDYQYDLDTDSNVTNQMNQLVYSKRTAL